MQSILKSKTYHFAIDIVKLSRLLNTNREYVISRQIISGTSLGAMVREAEFAQSKADFIHKLTIALKESNETRYWLCLLRDTDSPCNNFEHMENECKEIITMLVASVKTAKRDS